MWFSFATNLAMFHQEGLSKYRSAISVPQTNCIYFISDAKRVLRYNIADGTTAFIGDDFAYDGDYKWEGACLSTVDGCIYCAPHCHRQVMKINPIDETTTFIGEEYNGYSKWNGCVEAPDGTIYCSPYNASNLLKIDVRTRTTSLVGEIQQPERGLGWGGCVSSTINGNMYIFMIPWTADRILMFDTTKESVHEVGLEIRGYYNPPSISFIDGNAYAIPLYCSKSMLKINLLQLQTLHQAIQVKGMPWAFLKSIAESNIHALEQGDSNTGLLPFMIAAKRKRKYQNEEASLASLTLTYQLLSMKPAVMNRYVRNR